MKAKEALSKEVAGGAATIPVAEQTRTREWEVSADKKISLARILVATDFSAVSDRALDYALSLARRYDSKLFLTHILIPDAYQTMEAVTAGEAREIVLRTGEEGMAKILRSGKLKGVPYETVIEEGTLWPAIEEVILKNDIDFLVVGTQGMGGVKKVLIGSSAEQIFRQAKCPVLTVGPSIKVTTPNELDFKNILFATDFGVGAERQAAYALSLAQEHGAKLTLLHVVTHAEDYSEEGLTLKREAIHSELRELVPPGQDVWCQAEDRMRLGDPVEEILRMATETNADLIVMGAKKQKGLAGYMPRTKAYATVCKAPCPVLTVRS